MDDPSFSVLLYNCMLEIGRPEEEIAMRRTETDMCDYLYNDLSCVAIHRRSAGSYREGILMRGSDMDIMYYPTDHHVIWDVEDAHCYNPTTETIILMEYQESIPGTVYLRLLNMHPMNNAITKQSCLQRESLSYISSKKFLENADKLYSGQKVTPHGPCQTNRVAGNDYDGAVGFVGRKWPPQANDWVSRCMRFKWPEKKVLENIVVSGCHFVPVGSKQSRHENDPNLEYEWRMSFVQAEQKLVYAMTHCQFLCYALLKVFLKEVLNRNVKEEDKLLCSYNLKTAMFWAIQTDPEFHWSKENFFCCFWKCFKLLLQWVYTGYCPHFFIPQNNLFVCKIVGADQEKLFTQMYDLYCSREQSLAQCFSLMKIMMFFNISNRLHESATVCFDEYRHDAVLQQTLVSINALQNQELNYNRKAFYNVTHMDTGSTSLIEKVLIKRHALNVYHQIAFIEQISCHCEVKCKRNRQTYRNHKRVGSQLLKLTSEFGCASDNLYLALLQYLDGKFKYSLTILEEAKTRLYQKHVFYWNEYENDKAYTREMLGKPMAEKMKKAMAFEIYIPLFTKSVFCELEAELSLLEKTRKRRALMISPFVFHLFLVFLCHHREKSPLADRSLQELHTLVSSDSGQYIVSHTRDIAWEILGICHQLAGNLDLALQAYLTSLEQTPINFITEATNLRVLLLSLIDDTRDRQHQETGDTKRQTTPRDRRHQETDNTKRQATPRDRQHQVTNDTKRQTTPRDRRHQETDDTKRQTTPSDKRHQETDDTKRQTTPRDR